MRALGPGVAKLLRPDEKAAWEYVVSQGLVTSSALMRELGFDERKAQRVLRKLVGAGLLRRVGQGPGTRYEIVRS